MPSTKSIPGKVPLVGPAPGAPPATTTRGPVPGPGFMLRLPEDALSKLDARVEKMRAEMPGVTITRQDVVRQAILVFLTLESRPKGVES